MVVLATIQHTGTWFLIDMIQELTSKKVSLLQDVLTKSERFEIMHSHITTIDYGIHDNDVLKHFRPVILDALINTYKTIIPVRDPLLSLITRQNRHPKLNHYYIIDSFDYVARMNKENILFFPVDLHIKFRDRLGLVKSLADFLDLTPDPDVLKRIAKEWTPKNLAEDVTGLKEKYINGDYKSIKKALPHVCAFLEQKPNIPNFLHELGYGKFIWEK